ncbi:MAG TPA: type II secretion system F family protein [Mesorhizobium sp.]
MFGFDLTLIAFIALAGFSAGGIAYAFLAPNLQQEKATVRRLGQVAQSEAQRGAVKASRDRVSEVAKRRKSVQDSLKEIEAKQAVRLGNMRKPPLSMQLKQAGMSVTVRQFYLSSALFAAVAILVAVFVDLLPWYAMLALPVVAGVGIPRWVVKFRKARRIKQFLSEFPNALDIIVRAVKSGLPLNDGIRLIANEAQEPVKTEFRRIIEAQQVGLSIPEATLRMVDTMPCPEASFFGIVIQIQSQAGGNLAEALGNLSRVLRDRKKMKAKVQALSMEAKASAAIIGALPFIVTFLIYLSSPSYITLLFTEQAGHIIIGVSLFWMSIGLWVMRNMINFEV